MPEIQEIMYRAWSDACQGRGSKNCAVANGQFCFILKGNPQTWAHKALVAGVPEAADQDVGDVEYAARWQSWADMLFGEGGLIAQRMDNYEMRAGQLHMARMVQRAIEMDAPLVSEAQTGIGKSLAYAAPCMAMNKKVIISTSNKALQQQLVTKDIPFLQGLFPDKKLALAVGKENYACREKIEDVNAGAYTVSGALLDWYLSTETGNIEEIPLAVDFETLGQMRLDDDCTGKFCPRYGDCFYYVSRRQREEADVIVCNHALLALHQVYPGAGILPPADVIVVDEAHKYPDYVRAALGAEVRLNSLPKHVRLVEKFDQDSRALQAAIQRYNAAIQDVVFKSPDPETSLGHAEIEAGIILAETLVGYASRIWDDEIKPNDKEETRRAKAADRLSSMAGKVALTSADHDGLVRWVQRDNEGLLSVVAQPADVDKFVGQTVRDQGCVIFTSATLAAPDLAAFKREIGVESALELVAPSPFDYPNQALLYVPSADNPSPKDDNYLGWLVGEIDIMVKASGGGAFLLFTSYKAMHYAAGELEDRLTRYGLDVLVQGRQTKQMIIDTFKRVDNAVLFATKSFWEGVSIDGEALRLVVIDRMPFDPPRPLSTAQGARIKQEAIARGVPYDRAQFEPFYKLSVPKMIIDLKQGAGRLIRTKQDYGVIALMDSRARQAQYGRKLVLPALPDAARTASVYRVVDFFEQRKAAPDPQPFGELEPAEQWVALYGNNGDSKSWLK